MRTRSPDLSPCAPVALESEARVPIMGGMETKVRKVIIQDGEAVFACRCSACDARFWVESNMGALACPVCLKPGNAGAWYRMPGPLVREEPRPPRSNVVPMRPSNVLR